MSIIDDLNNKVALEQAQNHFNNLLEEAKVNVAYYEETLKAIAEKLKSVTSSTVEKAEEVVEAVKEEVKKAAPKKTAAKKTAKKDEAEETPAEEPETDK